MKYTYSCFLIVFLLGTIGLFGQTTYQYDNLNRLTQTNYPNGAIETFSYDLEGNRLSYTLSGVAATVDLSFTAQTASASELAAGATGSINFTLENTGNSAAGNQQTYFYLSADTDYDAGADTEIGNQYMSSIPSTGTASSISNITIPAGTTPGSYYIVCYTDGDGVVTETDELNNQVYIPINISVSESCPPFYELSQGFNSGFNAFLQAMDYIIADNVIMAGANIMYAAGDSITLEPGFEVLPGAEFEAFINGCGAVAPREDGSSLQNRNLSEEGKED